MSLTEPTTSPAHDTGGPLDAPAPAHGGLPSAWKYLRTLSGGVEPDAPDAPGPAGRSATAPEWADDERLDELFSAWAEAALSADVIPDRSFMDGDEPRAWSAPAGEPAGIEPDDGGVRPAYPTSGAGEVDEAARPAGDDASQAFPAARPEPVAWTRGDDDVIPSRRRGRWLRRR